MTISPFFEKINSWISISPQNNKRYLWILDKKGNIHCKERGGYNRFKEIGRLQTIISSMSKVLDQKFEIQQEDETKILLSLRTRINEAAEKYNKKHCGFFGFLYRFFFAYSLKKTHTHLNDRINECLSNHLQHLSLESFEEFIKNRPLSEISREKLDKEKIKVLIKHNINKIDRLNSDCRNELLKMAPYMENEELKILCKHVPFSEFNFKKFNKTQVSTILGEFVSVYLNIEEKDILIKHAHYISDQEKLRVLIQKNSINQLEVESFNSDQINILIEENLQKKNLSESEIVKLLKHSLTPEQFVTLVRQNSIEKFKLPSLKIEQIHILVRIKLKNWESLSEIEREALIPLIPKMDVLSLEKLMKNTPFSKQIFGLIQSNLTSQKINTIFKSRINLLPNLEEAEIDCLSVAAPHFREDLFKKFIQHVKINKLDLIELSKFSENFKILLDHCVAKENLSNQEFSELTELQNNVRDVKEAVRLLTKEALNKIIIKHNVFLENGLNNEQINIALKNKLKLLQEDTEELDSSSDTFLMRHLDKILDTNQFEIYLRLTNLQLPTSDLNSQQLIIGLKHQKIQIHVLSNDQILQLFDSENIKSLPGSSFKSLNKGQLKALGMKLFNLNPQQLDYIKENPLTPEQRERLK